VKSCAHSLCPYCLQSVHPTPAPSSGPPLASTALKQHVITAVPSNTAARYAATSTCHSSLQSTPACHTLQHTTTPFFTLHRFTQQPWSPQTRSANCCCTPHALRICALAHQELSASCHSLTSSPASLTPLPSLHAAAAADAFALPCAPPQPTT
jgi:hypothetical protein